MKPTTAILLLGGAYVAYKLAQTAVSAYNLTFGIANADFQCGGIVCTQPEVTIGLRVQNPGPGAFTINSMSGNFTFNNVYAGNVSSFVQKELPAHSEIIYPVTVRVTLATLIGNLSSMFSNGIKGDLGISGSMSVSGLQVPVITSYRLI